MSLQAQPDSSKLANASTIKRFIGGSPEVEAILHSLYRVINQSLRQKLYRI